MKSKLLLSALFITVFLVSSIIHMPIAWLIQHIPTSSQVMVRGVTGTLWQGKAETIILKKVDLGQLTWQFEPMELLSGGVAFSTRFGRGAALDWSGKGIVGYNTNGAYAKGVLASVKAASLMKQIQMAVPVQIEGQLELTLNNYQFSAPWCEMAEGELVWSDAELKTPLGAVNPVEAIATLACQESMITLKSVQDSTQLSSEFSVELHPDATYKLSGWVKPGDKLPKKVRSQLKWLGSPNSKGQYKINHVGRL